ncbi:MAG: hypothetical protein QW191_06840 [Conexivisphaerales archaeon]
MKVIRNYNLSETVLSTKSKGTVSTAFRKIGIDSINHAQMLRLIQAELSKKKVLNFPDDELLYMIKNLTDITNQLNMIINKLKDIKGVDRDTTLNKL